MSSIQKGIALLIFSTAALGGFFVLPLAHATLWLIFLVIAFPVSVSFIAGTLDGTKFSPAELVQIYAQSVEALPKLLGRSKRQAQADKD